MDNIKNLHSLLPVVGLTCVAFIFNTSEFIPIGLLTDISSDFGITEAHAGMIISVYAWVVMLLSLPLMMLVSKMEMRKLMLGTIVLFVLSQIASSLSAGYAMLMASRIGVACTHAVFWSIVSPMAVRIVDEKHRALALSMIVTGTSVAMIFGLPLGRVIGLHIGWRMTFLCVGIFAFIMFLCLLKLLPKVPSRGKVGLHQLPGVFREPMLNKLFFLSLLVATAYYTAYSYIEPFMKQVAAVGDSWITFILMLFGGAGIVGSLSFSRCYEGHPRRFLSLVILGIVVSLWLLLPSAHHMWLIMGVCLLWGAAVTAFNVAMQSEIINHAPSVATSVAMSVFSGIFNLGIGMGTLAGGMVCTHFSIDYIGVAGGVLALLAFAYWQTRVSHGVGQ